MLGVILTFVFADLAISMAATDCPSQHWLWNGTSCKACSGCPLGSGVKTSCSEKKDTECQSCWLGFDFSNTTGMETCMACSAYSINCLEGNAKIIANCTLVSPPVCQGCAEENFFDPGAGENGGCNKCSSPCGFLEVESRKCTTAHDRQCQPITQWKTTKVVEPITEPNIITTKADGKEESPSETDTNVDGTEQSLKEPDSFIEKHWPWVLVVSLVVPGMGISLLVWRGRRRRGRRRRQKRQRGQRGNLGNDNNPAGSEQGRRLLPPHYGLDSFIRDLSIEDRRVIAQRLNGKYHDGYYYWQNVAEKLGLRDVSRDWERAENPTEKLLSSYGEKDGSTIRNFIKALKEAGMTLLATELENKFTVTRNQEEDEKHVTDTWV